MVKGGSDKTGVGRALVKQHQQTAQHAKERNAALRKQNRVLEFVTEITDIDAIVEQAEEVARVFDSVNPLPELLINL